MCVNDEHSIIDCFVKVAPYFNKLVLGDIAVTIVDAQTQKLIAYVPGEKIDHKVKAGDPCPENTKVMEAMRTGEKNVKAMGIETFGFPYVGVSLPIVDTNDKLLGGISVNQGLEKQNVLLKMADNLQKAILQTSASTEKLAGEAEELSAVGENLAQLSENLADNVSESDSVFKVVQ